MREQKKEKPKVFRGNAHVITEIRATRGRNAEHFIKIFRHESDNIAGASLGVLLGVFEIDDQSEDSKYIVNFLFSVAKNEYFCNPRRGAMESFEAALHKINTALAEIVKHGNIDWLGKFHGTIAILEKNSIHLSATGDGRIYLFRNGNLSHISEGIASSDAAEHPIKTFIEISSGRLSPNDRLLFVLPKIFTLIDEETLARQARRMDREHFVQFLRTAMINELEQGGAIIVDIEEPQELVLEQAPKTTRQRSEPKSYFSETAFETKREGSVAAALSEEYSKESLRKPEYTDTKTGHIYIQGEQGALPIEESRFAQYLEEFFHSSTAFKEQGSRAFRRYLHTLSERTKLFCIVSGERIRHFIAVFFKKHVRHQKKQSGDAAESSYQESSFDTPEKFTSSPLSAETKQANISIPFSGSPSSNRLETPSPSHEIYSPQINSSFSKTSRVQLQRVSTLLRNISNRLSIYWKKQGALMFVWILKALRNIALAIQFLATVVRKAFFRMSLKGRIISVSILGLFLLSIVFWSIFSRNTSQPVPEKTPEALNIPLESPVRAEESHTADLPQSQLVSSNPETIATTYLNGTIAIITATTVEIPSLSISAVLPAESGTPRLIAPMNDLHALFILTDTGKLLSFTPANQDFSENTFPIGTNTPISLGAYLTYLYTLNTTGDTVLRFPRTPGGFGDGTSWLKQDISPSQHPSLAVNDFLYIFSDHSLVQFSHGKEVRSLEMPHKEPESLFLATEPDNKYLVGLDTANHRVIVWNTEGQILQQYFSDILSSATSIALHGNMVAISTPADTFEVEIAQ